jgi:hypothetical protein
MEPTPPSPQAHATPVLHFGWPTHDSAKAEGHRGVTRSLHADTRALRNSSELSNMSYPPPRYAPSVGIRQRKQLPRSARALFSQLARAGQSPSLLQPPVPTADEVGSCDKYSGAPSPLQARAQIPRS